MKKKAKTIAVIVAALLVLSAHAGYCGGINKVVVPSGSDARITVPFTRHIEGAYEVTSVAGFSVAIADTLAEHAYANMYYVRFISGNAAGLWSTITDNAVSSVDLEDEDVLAQVNVGDVFRIYKHQTIGSTFPKGLFGRSYLNGTQVFIYDNNIDAMVQNKSSAQSLSYVTAGTPRWVGASGEDTILKPETLFIVRNNSTTQPLDIYTFGHVPDYTVSMLIAPAGDLVIGSGYPVDVALKSAGIEGSGRTIFFYNNLATGKNKSSYASAACPSGSWVGSGANESIKCSQSVTLRLAPAETGTKISINKPY